MNILDVILKAQDGGAVRQLGSQFGLGEEQTSSAVSALVPALAAGFQRNMQTPDGLTGLVSALSSGNHHRYVEDPTSLADQGAVADGNGILGHVLGSKDVSREVASQAAGQTGLSADVMKQMLPLVATMMMGAFSQQRASVGSPSAAGLSGGGLGDLLGSLVDQQGQGSAAGGLSGILGRILGR